jgi:hypothetical protein
MAIKKDSETGAHDEGNPSPDPILAFEHEDLGKRSMTRGPPIPCNLNWRADHE